jgi:Fe-Mn family superoxide dismutase
MKMQLPKLDYPEDALAPHISAQTVEVHYHKHHAGYLKKLEQALGESETAELPLEQIIRSTEGSTFNSAAQVWNHNFYWKSLTPEPCDVRDDQLSKLIERSFGSMDGLKENFAGTAAAEFGSGWTWLAYHPQQERLSIFSTTDAVTPVLMSVEPLLTLDVWEHAYYLDYQNDRKAYIDAFLDRLANWEFAGQRLKEVLGS